MELYCATSDVKSTGGDKKAPPSVDLTTSAPPEVQKPATATNLQTGVSTNSALLGIENDQSKTLEKVSIGMHFVLHMGEKKGLMSIL